MRHALLTLFAPVALIAAAPAPDPTGARWWAHVVELADDKYEGRLTGTPGYDRAAAYVAGQFKAAGLKPAGTAGYLQSVAFTEQTVDAASSSLSLSGAGGAKAIAIGPDALLGSRILQRATTTAPLVFIGYGLSLPEAGYNDFAGQDLRGKVIVVINGGPATLSAALKSHGRSGSFWPAVAKAGVIGVISISNPKSADIPWDRQRLLATAPGMMLADTRLRDATSPKLSVTFNPARADLLFAPVGRSIAALLALADAGKPLPHFDLKQSITATVAATTRPIASTNIVGVLPGSDAGLASDYVVVSAHLDHIGVGPPIAGDRVYNGAMDNASGVASLIETAKTLAADPPMRSTIFLAICGEERGLLGSRHFANRPTVPAANIVADINMDMFLPIYPLTQMVAYGADQSSLGIAAAAAAKAAGVKLVPDPAPDRNIFVRSDQYSFIRTGVPSLSLKFSAPAGSPGAAAELTFLRDRYHAPSDDTDQPVDKPAAAKFDAYLADLIRHVADAPARPAWNEDSFFKRFAHKPTQEIKITASRL